MCAYFSEFLDTDIPAQLGAEKEKQSVDQFDSRAVNLFFYFVINSVLLLQIVTVTFCNFYFPSAFHPYCFNPNFLITLLPMETSTVSVGTQSFLFYRVTESQCCGRDCVPYKGGHLGHGSSDHSEVCPVLHGTRLGHSWAQ